MFLMDEKNLMLLISQHHGRIAQQPVELNSPKRGIAKALPKTSLIQREQLGKIDRIHSRPRLETFLIANGCAAVPGTSLLTCIAAKQSIAAGLSQFLGNGTGRFDSQVTDALSRIKPIRGFQGAHGTGI
jgi:hypothetical protein